MEKIIAAKGLGFTKVIVPKISEYDKFKTQGIEVIESIDIIDAYNNFNNENYKLKTYDLNKDSVT